MVFYLSALNSCLVKLISAMFVNSKEAKNIERIQKYNFRSTFAILEILERRKRCLIILGESSRHQSWDASGLRL